MTPVISVARPHPSTPQGTSGLEGEFQSGSEVDFYIDKNMIHIADTKVARR